MTDLLAAFFIGVVSVSHCLGMCGGLMVATGLSEQGLKLKIAYNFGRISTYTFLGLVFGFFSFYLPSNVFPVLKIMSSLLLLLTALYFLGASTLITRFEKIGLPLWRLVQPMSKNFLPPSSIGSAFALGSIWGLIPCGLVYTALAYSISIEGDFMSALAMFSFGLGTLPAMLGSMLAAQSIQPVMKLKSVRITLSFSLIFLAVWLFSEAINLRS